MGNAFLSKSKGLLGSMQMELLWQNASPNSDFAAQNISLDLTKYQYIMVDTYTTPGAVMVRKGGSSAITLVVTSSTSANKTVLQLARRMVYFNDERVTFEDCISTLYTTTSGKFSDVAASNSAAKPYRIYGVKGVG